MNKFLRVIAIAICISLVLVCLSSCTTNANYFTFEPNSDETGYIITGTAKILPDKVVLPNKYQGKPVVKATIESKSVKQLTIPSNIEELSLNCKYLTSINVSRNEHFKVQDEVLYTSDITRIVYVLPIKQGEYVIPRTTTSANYLAFIHANITALYIPKEYTNACIYYFETNDNSFDKITMFNDKININFEIPQPAYNESVLLGKLDNNAQIIPNQIYWNVPID